jgi:hypothetical protein
VSITGPHGATGADDTPSRRRLFVCEPAAGADANKELDCARTILSTVMRRAYRRPISKAEVEGPMAFYREGRAEGNFDTGISRALSAVLINPEFLFRVESDPRKSSAGGVYRISDLELASRLSFFLWSSIPDDELLDAAIRGRLSRPDELEKQTRRMLADARSFNLATNFAGQWLRLRNLDAVTPNMRLFPDFDDNLRQAFRTETEMLFASIVHEDRSLLDMLTADYTFVNDRLARHYGMTGIYGSDFRRVPVAQDERRGILGHGSLLMVTSYPERTSPVQRGVWVLENIIGAPVPTPPPNVPALEEQAGTKNHPRTLREQMELHNARPFCAGCHKIMDPVGFALENFDAVGKWRTEEHGEPIVATGKLVDGTEIDGASELRAALLKYSDRFVQTVTEKLMTYALGRGLEYYDMPAVRQIARASEKDAYKFSSIVIGIVESPQFQMRARESAPEATEIVAGR